MARQSIRVTRVVSTTKTRRTPITQLTAAKPNSGNKPGNTNRCPNCGKFKGTP